jgi:hypothetical protein
MTGHGMSRPADATSRAPARICPPCHGNCNQGRDCPTRYPIEADQSLALMPIPAWPILLVCVCACLLLVALGAWIGFAFGGTP